MLIIEANKVLDIVIGILFKNRKVLIASRPPSKKFAGYFEFPGGKVEKGEFLLEALYRELNEELKIKVKLNRVIFFTNYQIQREKKINLNFFICESWEGNIFPNEKQNLYWAEINQLSNFKILKSNYKVIRILKKQILFPRGK